MTNYKKELLHKLLDKYERSKSFIGKNQKNQSFSLKISAVFPAYEDDSMFDLFQKINQDIAVIEDRGFVNVSRKRNGVVKAITLNVDQLDAVYEFLGRTAKSDMVEAQKMLLKKYRTGNELLSRYCDDQLAALEQNRKVRHYDDLDSFEQILKTLAAIMEIPSETFERDFSVHVLGDSKSFSEVKSKVISILMEYGDFPNSDTVLEDLNVVRNPGHIYFKGQGIVHIGQQSIDCRCIPGDFAISSSAINAITSIEIPASRVVTIENLTTFNMYQAEDCFCIYLGGYHNKDRRDFICKLYEEHRDKEYLHFGDIDAGGFYILMHLRRKTGVPFRAYQMDVETLRKYQEFSKPLTGNDRKRLENLANQENEFSEVIRYMLDYDCKLEQEAVPL